jgi:hypothetical protein
VGKLRGSVLLISLLLVNVVSITWSYLRFVAWMHNYGNIPELYLTYNISLEQRIILITPMIILVMSLLVASILWGDE